VKREQRKRPHRLCLKATVFVVRLAHWLLEHNPNTPRVILPQPSSPLNPQPSDLTPQPSTLNPQLSTRNPQPCVIRLAHWLLEHNPNTPRVILGRRAGGAGLSEATPCRRGRLGRRSWQEPEIDHLISAKTSISANLQV